MKKLVIGKGLEEKEAFCWWCKEEDKTCIESSYRYSVQEFKTIHKWGSTDIIIGFWGNRQANKTRAIEEVVSSEWVKKDPAHICHDCINQLVKLIK